MKDSSDIPNASALRIEPYEPSDLDEIMAIENVSFSTPWSRESYEELAPLDSVDMRVVRMDGRLVGYMLCQRVGEEMELHTIAVAPECRRRGIARMMMDHIIEESGRRGIRRIFLQVRPSNRGARSLYNEFGFKVVGMRHAYYRDNGEDALVMRFELKGSE